MKKIITLIILLAAGGAVFFLGWAQPQVPVGSYGVLRSKTHGTRPEVIKDGKFCWIWYKLIPKNVEITVFKLEEHAIPLDFSGILPSGDTYSALAGLRTDFSYSFSGSLTYKIKADSLPALCERENLLSQAELDLYVPRLSKEIEHTIMALLWDYGENEKLVKQTRETGKIETLEKAISQAFPETEITGSSVKILRFPDFVLYNEMKELYRDYLAAQRINLKDTVGRMAGENIQNRRRLDELAGYGELLTKYPILVEYLALEMGKTP